jgi:hypothetical protein
MPLRASQAARIMRDSTLASVSQFEDNDSHKWLIFRSGIFGKQLGLHYMVGELMAVNSWRRLSGQLPG